MRTLQRESVYALPDAACREAAVNQRWYSVNYALCSLSERRALVFYNKQLTEEILFLDVIMELGG